MKEYLASLTRTAPSPTQARNLVREYLQARILGALQRAGAIRHRRWYNPFGGRCINMEKELKTIEISHIPELVRIAEEVYTSGEARVLRRKRKHLVVLKPLRSSKRASSRGKSFTRDDSLWNIVGIGRSGLADVSENKHKYLAEAYALRT